MVGQIVIVGPGRLRDVQRRVRRAVAVEPQSEVAERVGLDRPEEAEQLVLVPGHGPRHAAGEVGPETSLLVVRGQTEVGGRSVLVRGAAALVDLHRADAGGLAAERVLHPRHLGGRRRRVHRGREIEVEVAAEKLRVVTVVLRPGGDPEGVGDLEVHADVAVVPDGRFGRVAETEARHPRNLGVVVRQVGVERVIDHLRLLLGEGVGIVVPRPDAQPPVEEHVGVFDAPVRLHAVVVLVIPSRLFLPRLTAHRVEGGAGAEADETTGPVKGPLGTQIDHPGQRAARVLRLRRAAQVHGLDAVDRHLFKFKAPVRSRAAGRCHARTRDRRAIQRHRGVLRVQSTQTDGTGVRLDIVDQHARQELEKLADVALGNRAKRVRGQDPLRLDRLLLFHDRLRVALALGGHDKLAQFDRTRVLRVGQRDVDRDGLAGDHVHRLHFCIQTGVHKHHPLRPGRHALQAEHAPRLRRGRQRGALD